MNQPIWKDDATPEQLQASENLKQTIIAKINEGGYDNMLHVEFQENITGDLSPLIREDRHELYRLH